MRAKLEGDVRKTGNCLRRYPVTYERLKKYMEEVEARLKTESSPVWISYQSSRLNRIIWLLNVNDDGTKTATRLRMRPYDIPWVIWGIGAVVNNHPKCKKAYNGWVENAKKIMACPKMEIEFTEEFAGFCYLCSYMTADGCAKHPDFGGYGKVFPQSKQMSDLLKKDSDQALAYLGLKWDDVVTAEELLALCVEKAPDPSVFPVSDFRRKNTWPPYREGIKQIKSGTAGVQSQ